MREGMVAGSDEHCSFAHAACRSLLTNDFANANRFRSDQVCAGEPLLERRFGCEGLDAARIGDDAWHLWSWTLYDALIPTRGGLMHDRGCVCSFVPPYILSRIAERGDD